MGAEDPASGADLQSTASLVIRIRQGDPQARERLVQRYLTPLRRWAHGRLPPRARDLAETDDLVQVTLLRALDHVDEFESRRAGGFMAYLRRILMNQIKDEIRRVQRRPAREPIAEEPPADDPTPLERVIGKEALESYELALERLSPELQEAVMLRLELGFTHEQVAEAVGFPSANAARMAVARALIRLTEMMDGAA